MVKSKHLQFYTDVFLVLNAPVAIRSVQISNVEQTDPKNPNVTSGIHKGPYFQENLATSIIAQVGSTSYLPCIVCQTNGRAVSWVRKRDAHILAINGFTFVPDMRFKTQHIESNEEYSLEIRSLQPRDSGLFECQVATYPKISHIVNLTVVAQDLNITPGPLVIIKCGSVINISCTITPSAIKPHYTFWFHNELRLFENDNMITIRLADQNDILYSILTIYNANTSHSGNYTCLPTNMHSTSTYVHVVEDTDASMSKNRATRASLPLHFWTSVTLVTCLSSLGPFSISEENAIALLTYELITMTFEQLISVLTSLLDVLM